MHIISFLWFLNTVCPRSSDPFYIVSYYLKWVSTFWTYSMCLLILYVQAVVTIQKKIFDIFASENEIYTIY